MYSHNEELMVVCKRSDLYNDTTVLYKPIKWFWKGLQHFYISVKRFRNTALWRVEILSWKTLFETSVQLHVFQTFSMILFLFHHILGTAPYKGDFFHHDVLQFLADIVNHQLVLPWLPHLEKWLCIQVISFSAVSKVINMPS